jgi:membrane-associated protease RseP (regulator of RpoE activity)
MKPLASAVLSLLLLAAAGCTTYSGHHYVGSRDQVLAARTGENGSRETYELRVRGAGGDAVLRVTSEYDRRRAFLGFKVVELDKAQAERRGVQPFTGLLVTGTYPKSAAEAAGVLGGDVLLLLDGKETVYAAQIDQVEAALRRGQNVAARVRRGQTDIDLSLVAGEIEERVTDPQEITLEAPPAERPFAGVTLRGIPESWCHRIYGEARNAVAITSVEVGSPAWLAGFRGGDVVDAVDGAPVPNVRDLARTIAERGVAEQPIRLRVSRADAPPFEAEVELRDYLGGTTVWLPLVFAAQDGVYEDTWSVGPFGLLLRNRSTYVADSTTRDVQERNVFSALFGLFRVDTGPRDSSIRLLWLIHIDV